MSDPFIELPVPALMESNCGTITEVDVYNNACMIFAKLISVPRNFNEQKLLDLTFQELGYQNTTHAYLIASVDHAKKIKDLVVNAKQKSTVRENKL